ncbi:MAG: glycoside hydrolase family 113 [Bacilli bacterium]
MDYIKGISYTLFEPQALSLDEQKESIKIAQESLGLSHIALCYLAFQATPFSVDIDYQSTKTPSKEVLIELITYAQSLGLKVILKPMLDCLDGTWRAHINFFDIDAPCEPSWPQWFKSYNKYLIEQAQLAQTTKCCMLVIGTEMIQTERRSNDWINLIKEIRKVYDGLITYNTDKYQEGNVLWWEHVDVISASGYYPLNELPSQIKRIKALVDLYQKPYFFAEAGCPSTTNACLSPHDWKIKGEYDPLEQAIWIEDFINNIKDQSWIYGITWWGWSAHALTLKDDKGYDVYQKQSQALIKAFYQNK